MKHIKLWLACFFCLLLCFPPLSQSDRGIKRKKSNLVQDHSLALVIGNSAYRSAPLRNPENDALAMTDVLEGVGFEVIGKTNLDFQGMNRAIDAFGERLGRGGVGFFYFAGHGIQFNGRNYLIPVNSNIQSENEIKYRAVDAGLVLAKMESARTRLNIVVLDACRDNPFARSFRSAARGLAFTDAPNGSVVAYATAPGKTASDGSGANGLYTSELIRQMRTPGLRLMDIFFGVRREVRQKSNGKQVPWESISLVEPYYFIPPDGEQPALPPPSATMASLRPAPTPKIVSPSFGGGTCHIDSDPDSQYVAENIKQYLSGRRLRFSEQPPAGSGDFALVFRSKVEEETDYNVKRVRLKTVVSIENSYGDAVKTRSFAASGKSDHNYEYALRQASDILSAAMKQETDFFDSILPD